MYQEIEQIVYLYKKKVRFYYVLSSKLIIVCLLCLNMYIIDENNNMV